MILNFFDFFLDMYRLLLSLSEKFLLKTRDMLFLLFFPCEFC